MLILKKEKGFIIFVIIIELDYPEQILLGGPVTMMETNGQNEGEPDLNLGNYNAFN